LTQAEAAAYLRVDEQTLLQMVGREDFPGRRVGTEWRFLKSALQDWLRTPLRQKRGILAHIGAFKDDPTLEEMVKEIYERRRRPMTEED
jgi:excisionase family DNA binding protein